MADRRAQIEARLAAGTGWCEEGPWRVTADPLGVHVEHGCGRGRVVLDVASDHPYAPRRAVADLIAHAPDDLRWLLDALAEAVAEREQWKEVADAADDVIRAVLAALYRGPDTDAVIRAKKVMAERDALAAKVAHLEAQALAAEAKAARVEALIEGVGDGNLKTSHLRAALETNIEDAYERGRVHAEDDAYRRIRAALEGDR